MPKKYKSEITNELVQCLNCHDGHRFTECQRNFIKSKGEVRYFEYVCPSCGGSHKYADKFGIVGSLW